MYCVRKLDSTKWVCAQRGSGTAQNGFVLCVESEQHEAGLHCSWNWDDTRLLCIAHGMGQCKVGLY